MTSTIDSTGQVDDRAAQHVPDTPRLAPLTVLPARPAAHAGPPQRRTIGKIPRRDVLDVGGALLIAACTTASL